MDWTPEQEQALQAVDHWLKHDRDKPWFYLGGFAGTGKTTLAIHLAKQVKGQVAFGAFTGKAALVMRSKGCTGATTIHSMIYKMAESKYDGKPKFVLNKGAGIQYAKLIVIDEVSMVNEKIAADLLSFGVPVLVLGDPAQLPPVEGTGFFTSQKPDFMLKEIHRQALDNPIIRMSMEIRRGNSLNIGNYGESKIIADKDMSDSDVTDSDQILVGKNITRLRYNLVYRDMHDYTSELPIEGEKLVCLRNNHENGLINGQLWTVKEATPQRKNGMIIDGGIRYKLDEFGGDTRVETNGRLEDLIGEKCRLSFEALRAYDRFDYGYALTTHKAQGSQWDNVFIVDESGVFGTDARRWLYTAITRAAEKVTIVR